MPIEIKKLLIRVGCRRHVFVCVCHASSIRRASKRLKMRVIPRGMYVRNKQLWKTSGFASECLQQLTALRHQLSAIASSEWV